jgi:zinc transport system permease protein
MVQEMFQILQYEFMQHALAAGLLTSLICGVIGTLVVVNRIVFLSGGIAHAAYGGIGLAFFMGWPYSIGAAGFSLAAALVMAQVTLKARHRADTIIGVIWAVGMALGIILLDLTPGYHPDVLSYLFGSILAVPKSGLYQTAGLCVGIVLLVSYFYNDFLAMSYDAEFAGLRGVPVKGLYLLLVAMIALAVVMTIRVVGLILVIALLTIPPYIAEQYVKSLAGMMMVSSVLSMGFTVLGLFLSYRFNLTSGAAIIMVAGCGFFISLLLKRPKWHLLHKPPQG